MDLERIQKLRGQWERERRASLSSALARLRDEREREYLTPLAKSYDQGRAILAYGAAALVTASSLPASLYAAGTGHPLLSATFGFAAAGGTAVVAKSIVTMRQSQKPSYTPSDRGFEQARAHLAAPTPVAAA